MEEQNQIQNQKKKGNGMKIVIGTVIALVVCAVLIFTLIPLTTYTAEVKKKDEFANTMVQMKEKVAEKALKDFEVVGDEATIIYKLSDLIALNKDFKSPFADFLDEYTYIKVTKENGELVFEIQGLDKNGNCLYFNSKYDKEIKRSMVKNNCKVDSLSASVSDGKKSSYYKSNTKNSSSSSKSTTKDTSSKSSSTKSSYYTNSKNGYKSNSSSKSTTTVHNETSALPKNRLYGDVDLDKSVSILDATYIQQYMAGKRTLSDSAKANADVNVDGKINNKDVIIIQKYLASLINSLPYTGSLVIYGDADLDGEVSIVDVTLIQRYAAGTAKLSAEAKENADVNLDGKVNAADASIIQLYLAEKTTIPHRNVKYGDANLDGTVDILDATTVGYYLSGEKTLSAAAKRNADVNIDGKVDDTDRVLIQKYVAGMIELPSKNVSYKKRYR